LNKFVIANKLTVSENIDYNGKALTD